MASNMECVGLAVDSQEELGRLVGSLTPEPTLLGRSGGIEVFRWEDPSGVRLTLGVDGEDIIDLVPSFAGRPGALLRNIGRCNEDVAAAYVVDDDGEQLTGLTVELEQRLLLPWGEPIAGSAAVTAMGVDVAVHADAEAYEGSPDSLLGSDEDEDEPPAGFAERGLPWPPRMGAESFLSYGLFAKSEEAEAYARMSGTVLEAARRTVVLTGQEFIVARVRTVGFEADVCLPASEHAEVPEPGQIVAGTVFLVASLDGFSSDPRAVGI